MKTQFQLDVAFPDQIIQATRLRYFHNLWLPVQISRRSPQPLYPLHNHDFDEIAYILKGYGVNFTGSGFQLLLPGNVIYMEAKDIHAYPLVQNLNLVNIFFDHQRVTTHFQKLRILLEEFQSSQKTNSRFFIDYPGFSQLSALANQLDTETFYSDEYSEFSTMAHLVQFLVLVLRQSHRESGAAEHHTEHRNHEKIFSLFADPDFPALFSREDLRGKTEQHGLAWRSFERILQQLTGLSPHELATYNRLIRLLNIIIEDPEITLEEAGYRAGFQDYRSLSRNCRTAFKCSPKELREKTRRYLSDPPELPEVQDYLPLTA